jgi:hypothetical protein
VAYYALRKVADDPGTVGTTSTLILPANENRKYCIIINTSDVDIYLRLGKPAALGSGIFLAKNGFAYEIDNNNLWVGAIYAIHGGVGNKSVSILEMS